MLQTRLIPLSETLINPDCDPRFLIHARHINAFLTYTLKSLTLKERNKSACICAFFLCSTRNTKKVK